MKRVPRLHLISDSRWCPLDRFGLVAEKAVSGGVDAVHLREKAATSRALLEAAIDLRARLDRPALLFVNDRVDVALLSDADGVELGESALPVVSVRSLVGERLLVGRSVHDVEGAKRAEADGANFVIAGHVYETASKLGQPGRGLAFVESVAGSVSIPVIAIGGITPDRVPHVIGAGAHGVAVLSGILAADDPAEAARRYAEELGHGRQNDATDD